MEGLSLGTEGAPDGNASWDPCDRFMPLAGLARPPPLSLGSHVAQPAGQNVFSVAPIDWVSLGSRLWLLSHVSKNRPS